MRVLITGVAGFLGSHLADAFLARGDRVVGIDNLIGGDVSNVPKGVDFSVLDCNNLPLVKRLMRAVDVVYHCAATAHEGLSVFSPYENAMNGYAASAAVFTAACNADVGRIVHCSSMARYGKGERLPFTEDQVPQPEDPYGIGKYASERLLKNMCETHHIDWTICVPHNIYGPRQKFDDPFRNVLSIFTNLMLQGRQPIVYGDGLQVRCFSYYSDVVEPLVKMALDDDVLGEVINIGPDEGVITVLDAGRKIADYLGFPYNPEFVQGRPREVKYAHCSADKARRLLNYEPKVSLDDGIKYTVEWIKEQGPRPFKYHLDLEIEAGNMPVTWSKRLF